MTWVKTDDNAPNHPKFARAGVEAYGWWHAALCYCNRYLTDGFIATKDLEHVFPGVTGARLKRLLTLLVTQGSAERTPRGIVIHDYLDYQPSRAKVLEERRVKAESGRLGGLKSGESRSSTKQPASDPRTTVLQHDRSKPEAPREPPTRPVPPIPTHLPLPPTDEPRPLAHATDSDRTPSRDPNGCQPHGVLGCLECSPVATRYQRPSSDDELWAKLHDKLAPRPAP